MLNLYYCQEFAIILKSLQIRRFTTIIDYLLMPKFEKIQATCSCFGVAVPNQQKYFLTRKRQTQEYQSSQFIRRVVKSTEIKNESEGKDQKKSLKKRPGSFANSDNKYPNSNIPIIQSEIQIKPSQEVHMKAKHQQPKGILTHTFGPKNSSILQYPEATNFSRIPNLSNSQKQQPQTKTNKLLLISPVPSIKQLNEPSKNIPQFTSPSFQYNKPHSQRTQSPSYAQVGQKKINLIQVNSEPSVTTHQIGFRELSSPTTPNPLYSQKNFRSHTQNWSLPFQDPLLAEDFQLFFRSKQESRNEVNFTKGRTNLKPREAQKSKRFQQQQLIGRFAQSEDQNVSQSSASEVIGKGFDRYYQEFIGNDQPVVCEQTKASRSTNTKVSNLKNQRPNPDEHQKRKFGNLARFTSYDRL